MFSKYKFILLTKLKAAALLAIFSILLTTNTGVLFAGELTNKNQPTINLNFENFPLNAIVHLVAELTAQDEQMIQLELLDGISVSVSVRNAPAYDLLDKLLAEHGLKVERTADTWTYSKM